MSLDMLEEEDISLDLSELQSISNDDLFLLIQEVIGNDNMHDGTLFCIQLFCNIMSNSIQKESFNDNYCDLDILSRSINLLITINKFDSVEFTNILLRKFIRIPLEVVWWLNKADIMYFSQYCNKLDPTEVADNILKIAKENKQNKTFPTEEVLQDLFGDLIRGCHRPNIGIYNLPRSGIWAEYCNCVLDDLINKTLTNVLKQDGKPCANIFPFINYSKKNTPAVIFKQFYKNILNKLLVYNVEKFDLYSSYIYQELWASDKIDNNLRILYEEIFERYCDINNILEIVEEHEEQVNWRLTLAAVGVCVKKSSTGYIDVKKATVSFLNESFVCGKFQPFIKAILLIRQATKESSMTNYRLWYSSTFGLNGDSKTTTNPAAFNFFITSLTKLITYEPKSYLKIHIAQAVSAPPKCNVLTHTYKAMCRQRLENLRNSPCVFQNGVDIAVLHMVEESFRNDCITPIMINIILTQWEIFNSTIVPQIVRNKPQYKKVKELLLKEKYITNELLHFTIADPDNKVFDDEDEDFTI